MELHMQCIRETLLEWNLKRIASFVCREQDLEFLDSIP